MGEEIREVKLDLDDVPRMFNALYPTMLCSRDIIAYIRGTIERDPWIPVVLDCNGDKLSLNELEESRIYVKGDNDNKASELSSLGIKPYFVIRAEELDPDRDDCGLLELEMEFKSKHNLTDINILLIGSEQKDSEILLKLRSYVFDNDLQNIGFPRFVVKQGSLQENGLDISVYCNTISTKRSQNDLDYHVLDKILEELDGKIVEGVTAIQDLEERHTRDVCLMSTYLVFKYKLVPVYIVPFMNDYIQYKFFYPMEQLSLYERINFLYRMPQVVGYLGINHGFVCLIRVKEKIYPKPHYVFNLDTMELVDNPEDFSFTTPGISFSDFRRSFRESQNAFVRSDNKSLSVLNNSDADVDKALVSLFAQLSTLVTEEPVYLSVKNCIYVMINGVKYLYYCPEECGIVGTYMSEYFGTLNHIITESEFHRLIDSQIAAALLQRSREKNSLAGSKALSLRWNQIDPKRALKPAIPIETTLYMNLLPPYRNGLSYYDSLLRCCVNVLPIITSTDSKMRKINPIFNQLPLDALRKDSQASKSLNCFGTLTSLVSRSPKLNVTYKSFENGGLL